MKNQTSHNGKSHRISKKAEQDEIEFQKELGKLIVEDAIPLINKIKSLKHELIKAEAKLGRIWDKYVFVCVEVGPGE